MSMAKQTEPEGANPLSIAQARISSNILRALNYSGLPTASVAVDAGF